MKFEVKNFLQSPRLKDLFFTLFNHGQGAPDLDGILSNFVTMLQAHGNLQKEAGRPHWDDYLSSLPIHFSTECCLWVHRNRLYLLGPVRAEGHANRRVAKLVAVDLPARDEEEEAEEDGEDGEDEGGSRFKRKELLTVVFCLLDFAAALGWI